MGNLKASVIITHITGWLIFLSMPLLFIAGQPRGKTVGIVLANPYYWIFFLVYAALFYTITYLLIPRLYLKKKITAFAAIILALLIAVYFLKPFDHLVSGQMRPASEDNFRERPMPPPPDRGQMNDGHPPRQGQRIDVVSVFLFIMVLALSMAVQITRRWRLTEQRALAAESGKAQAELSFLKAQINPHFLFNTLNNIYSLAVSKSDYTGEAVMKLSNIMRYVTDEVGEDFVPLSLEAECITDYIDLQRLRLGKNAPVDFVIQGNLENKKIAPLVLMTFVENVFKYGTSKHEASPITIKLQAEEHTITFLCRNKIFVAQQNTGRKGIGIDNARKRLQHLYPNRHFLTIDDTGEMYTVQLSLNHDSHD